MPADSGAHLTTSRINRLLRPLRNKCNNLAALPKAASCVAYSTRQSSWDPDSRPPLAILSTGTKKLTLDSCSADDFELSRRIYAVCDAFKNIAHVAFGQPCSKRIPSLAVLCSLVVGENMPPENALTDPGEDPADDILDVGGIYETVPSHYRRFLIVSHALSMILSICIHHHTLVTLLLDHCLSFGLVHESTQLLNIVLSQALLPSNSSYPPPATHPGHTNYLLDLYTKWTTGNKPSEAFSDTLLFTTATFCRVLIGTLSKASSCNSHKIWTSNVLSKLLHAVGSCDVDSYIVIVRSLTQSFMDDATEILDQTWSEPGVEVASPDTLRNKAWPAPLRSKLSELMSNLFDLLFAPHNSHSSLPLPEPPRIYAAIDILRDCYVARLHRFQMPTTGSSVGLPDMIVTFTTHIFVAFRNCADNFDGLLALLDDSSPVPTTFSKLMVYIGRSQGSQNFGDFVEAFLSELKLYSSALCSEKLFKLDASLWACALHHFETSMVTVQKGSSTLVTRYKQRLMDAVDKAEHRCFGGLVNSPVVSSNRLTHGGRTHHARTSGHWEWEDMVGSWVRKTPVHKKRKIDHSPLLRYNHSQPPVSSVELSTPDSTPSSTRHRRSSTFSSSSYFPSSDHEPRTEDEYQGETDKENYPSNLPKTVKGFNRRTKRRSSNFFSLLADAQVNRIVLHPKPRLKLRSRSSIIPEKYALPTQEKKTSCRNMSPSPAPLETLLPSDDSLNLFAYATSSPTRC